MGYRTYHRFVSPRGEKLHRIKLTGYPSRGKRVAAFLNFFLGLRRSRVSDRPRGGSLGRRRADKSPPDLPFFSENPLPRREYSKRRFRLARSFNYKATLSRAGLGRAEERLRLQPRRADGELASLKLLRTPSAQRN